LIIQFNATKNGLQQILVSGHVFWLASAGRWHHCFGCNNY